MEPNGEANVANQQEEIHLPTGIVSTSDVRLLKREITELENTLQAIRLRTNAPVAKLPRFGRALEEFSSTNRLNMLLPEDRKRAVDFVDGVLLNAPVLHISFASVANRRFTTELMYWIRTNLDNRMLVEIGLEPQIAAGCIVRTKNKMFDFSLMNSLHNKRELLIEKMSGATQ